MIAFTQQKVSSVSGDQKEPSKVAPIRTVMAINGQEIPGTEGLDCVDDPT